MRCTLAAEAVVVETAEQALKATAGTTVAVDWVLDVVVAWVVAEEEAEMETEEVVVRAMAGVVALEEGAMAEVAVACRLGRH